MKAKVVEVISGSQFIDRERRVVLKFDLAESMFRELRVRESMLPHKVELDDEIEFSVIPLTAVVRIKEDPLPVSGDEVVHSLPGHPETNLSTGGKR